MSLPNAIQKITKQDRTVTTSWYRFFVDLQRLLTSGSSSSNVNVEFDATCTASEAIGQPVYVSGINTVSQADASSESTADVVGFVVAKASTTSCTVRTNGVVSGLSGLTPGTTYFLSETTGGITSAPVTTSGAVLFAIGKALSSTELIITVSNQDAITRS